MINKVGSYICENDMLKMGDRIVIGVSGGADSVCLFYVFLDLVKKYNLELFVVHVNHGIRGQEADKDEAFVKSLCKEHRVSFISVKKDVPKIAKLEGLSEEEAGRNVRYEAFYQCYLENACNKIAVAHNKNDNAETILFHLFRGSGIKGLSGIPPKRDSIIRPLLCVEREEIERYLEKKKIPYIIDRSNLEEDYTRNKIRHKVLSYAKDEINYGAVANITNSAAMLTEIQDFLN